MIDNSEQIARALFSPKMVIDGMIQPEAFRLRPAIKEEYISVVRMGITSWQDDILKIPQRKNRVLYGYAEMNVGDIRSIKLEKTEYDIKECDNNAAKAHAGIFITYDGEPVVGGASLNTAEDGECQDFILLAIQRELVDIAQKGIKTIAPSKT